MNKPAILFSMPTRHHVEIAFDEMAGMQDLGYKCNSFPYAAKEGVTSAPGRLLVIIQNAFKLIKTAREFKPDIIYLNSRLEAVAGMRDFITISLVKLFYRRKVKFVLKSHGSDISILDNKRFLISKVILPYLKRNVSGWLFLSSEEKQILDRISYFESEKIFVTKNIVRTDHFEHDNDFKQKLSIPADYKLLLFIGRLIPEKGIYEVIRGFAKIKDNYKVKLIIVGWGSEEESLKQLSNTLNLGNDVIFTGFIPEQKVIPFYASCDVLVFPTYFPEGFPMSLFNSVAAGMPVITTRTRAAADYLTEPENCLWVEPKNSDAVEKALIKMLSSEQLLADMKYNNKLKGEIFSKSYVCRELAVTLNTIVE